MSSETSVTTTCDGCGKKIESRPIDGSSSYVRPPFDPWLTIRLSGHYVTDYGKALDRERDACSIECAIKMLEKQLERLQVLAKRFPSTVKQLA